MVTVELATRGDVRDLIDLNEFWCRRARSDQTNDGYVFGGAFAVTDWHLMIDANEVVVARIDGKPVGYYLIDNCTQTLDGARAARVRDELLAAGALPSVPVARRTQSAIALAHHGQGLTRLMLRTLVDVVRQKYGVLLAAVHEHNPKLAAHQAIGWTVVAHLPPYFYVAYRIEQSEPKNQRVTVHT